MKLERHPTLGPLFNKVAFFVAHRVRQLLVETSETRARAVGRFAGRSMRRLMGRRVALAARQAEEALGPGMGDVALRCFESFGEFMVEVVRIPRDFNAGNWKRRVDVEGEDRFQRAVSLGKGVIAVGAHLGNWEIGGCTMGHMGHKVSWLLRPLENPLIQQALNEVRATAGQRVITKWGGLKEAMRVLRRGEVLAMLTDQDARDQGTFVPFFGKPASTLKSPALLSMRCGAPIVPFAARRLPGGRFAMHFGEPILVTGGTEEENMQKATAQFTAALEGQIRLAPDQWLWVHRRWKSVPPAPVPALPAPRRESTRRVRFEPATGSVPERRA